jgi:hypothetical protein
MPKLKCHVEFPLAKSGRWHAESPLGAKVYEEYFTNQQKLSTELSVGEYNALVFVNNGESRAVTPPVEERRLTQSLYVVVTPGISRDLKFKSKPEVALYPTPTVWLGGKIRTKVTVSVS